MIELNKEVTGSWFQVKTVMENYLNLRDYFRLSKEELKETILKLRNSVENGISEYKKTIFFKSFDLVKSLNFDTSSLSKLKELAQKINCAVYVILIQRLIAKKTIALKPAQTDEAKSEVEKQYSIADVQYIIKEIQEISAAKPSLKTNKNINNISIQVAKYKNETETMKKILPNLPADKKDNFSANYKEIVNNIFLKIITSYNAFTKEVTNKNEKKWDKSFIGISDFSVIIGPLKKQAEIADRIKATFTFVDREKFKILETLQTLNFYEQEIKILLAREEKFYFNTTQSDIGKRDLEREFCFEIINIFEKQAKSA